jgi:hypothetical protein
MGAELDHSNKTLMLPTILFQSPKGIGLRHLNRLASIATALRFYPRE